MDVTSTHAPSRPPRPEQDDPRFRRLPWSDGRAHHRVLDAPSAESARLAEGFLRATHWGIHRVGQARGAHGPNGLRLVFAWRIAGVEPAPCQEPFAYRAARPGRTATQ